MTQVTDLLKKLFVGRSEHGFIQLIRYGIVVVVTFPIDIGLLYVFTEFVHIYYVLSAIMSFTLAMIVNYLLSVAWVFTDNKRSLLFNTTVFALIGFVGLGLTAGLVWLFTEVIHLQYLLSKLAAAVIVFFWSFAARRFLFKDKLAKNTQTPS